MATFFAKNELLVLPTSTLAGIQDVLLTRQEELTNKLISNQGRLSYMGGIVGVDDGSSNGLVPTRVTNASEDSVEGTKNSAGSMAAVSKVIDDTLAAKKNPITNPNTIGLPSNVNMATILSGTSSKLDDLASPMLGDILVREEALKQQKAKLLNEIAIIEDELTQLDAALSEIDFITLERAAGRIDEPVYDTSEADENTSAFLKDQIALLSATAELSTEFSDFDLVFGPPISKSGQFILASDGLYYDSRTGGLPTVVGLVEAVSKWKLEYAPNLGGKGKVFTEKDLLNITDTIFDLDQINDSKQMSTIYDRDLVIQRFREDRTKVVFDLSGQVQSAISEGEAATGAVVTNLKQNILAVTDAMNSKLRKRKKQVEAAIFFGGFIYKNERFYSAKTKEEVRAIPINDFSYLRGLGAQPSLEKQKSLVLKSGDVTETILPITPKFLVTPQNSVTSVDSLNLSFGGEEDFIHIEGFNVKDLKPFVKNLSDGIIKPMVGYSFISPKIEDPSSLDNAQDNFSVGHTDLDAKIVADSYESVFRHGLGIPYFHGLTGTSDTDTIGQSGKYSYGVVDNKKSSLVQDLFYVNPGVTYDFWAYVPPLTDPARGNPSVGQAMFTSGHLYRLFFGCENSGDSQQKVWNPNVKSQYDVGRTLGLICGLRSEQISDPTVTTLDAPERTEFVFAPTIGTNNSGEDTNDDWGHSIMLLNTGLTGTNGLTDNHEFKVSGTVIDRIKDEFVHISLRVDITESTVSMFLDGSLLATSSMQNVFGVHKPQVPSFFTTSADATSSIYYESGEGPDITSQLITPYTIGGGYSDMSPSGFLGANYDTNTFNNKTAPSNNDNKGLQHRYWSGNGYTQRSGLNGFIGSFKIYDKALTNTEIQTNYTAQKQFFKNIDLTEVIHS